MAVSVTRPLASSCLVAVCCIGCVRQNIWVSPREIAHHVRELRRKGKATVEARPSGSYELTMDETFPAVFPSGASKWIAWAVPDKKQNLSVAQLIANCPDVPPFRGEKLRRNPPCLLQQTSSKWWLVDSHRRPDWRLIGGITGGTLAAGGVAGMYVCAQECNGAAKTASTIGVATIAVTITVVGILVTGALGGLF